ncbi:metallophosphoesterase [Pseudescherichia sp.]|uniref:metallophosphoesterase n=1 Tax=Pseudescherichia sp. TaxID=2055881 RepID=UPI00289E6529|nr:metallophosphoesterase [Pseudescherichia sp.]
MLLAQLSDIHAAPDNDNLSRLACALTWLDTLQPDVLVLTGDLVDDGWLAGYQAIAKLLDSKPWPVFILPGNADCHEMMRAVWNNQPWSDTGAMHFVKEISGMRLIGLDTTVNGAAAGSVLEHLSWLEKHLAADTTLPAILFLHHHIFKSGIPALDNIMCSGHRELERLLKNAPRPLVAITGGHVHRPMMSNVAGIPAFICGSICPANPLWLGGESVPPVYDPPSLMIHRFTDGTLVSHHVSVSASTVPDEYITTLK